MDKMNLKTLKLKDGSELSVKNRFFASIKADLGETVFTISLEKAIELIDEKRKVDKEKTIKVFPEDENIQVLNGRYGPYIKAGKKNFRIPKGTDPKELTLEDCKSIIEKKNKS